MLIMDCMLVGEVCLDFMCMFALMRCPHIGASASYMQIALQLPGLLQRYVHVVSMQSAGVANAMHGCHQTNTSMIE